jgi:hypothetical protein
MEVSELANLEHFYASFNSLSNPAGSTQPLAGRFCMRDPKRLYSLILRANNFTGTVNMSHCEGLGLLDVQVGVLVMQRSVIHMQHWCYPRQVQVCASGRAVCLLQKQQQAGAEALRSFQACRCWLGLCLQDNRFYGALPIGITNQNLISLRGANNMFNSSIPEALWRLPQLATLELANNE